MNLAEPSGSSPPEKPPGSNQDLRLIELTDKCLAALGDIGGGQVLQHENVRVGRLHGWKARAVSYSQLVPGKTGMMTRGVARRTAGATRLLAGQSCSSAGTNSPALR